MQTAPATTDLHALHRRHVLTPWAAQGKLDPPSIERGEGAFIYDDTGKRYLDLSSGLVCVNLGHGNAAVAEAIAEQAKRLAFTAPSFFNSNRAELGAALSELSPWSEGARAFFTTGGAEANEDAVKIARTLTGRSKVLTAYRSFHGSGAGASTLTGENRRWFAEPGIPNIIHFIGPNPYRSPFHAEDAAEETRRALEHLEFILTFENPKKVAAILLETVVGSNGVIVAPPGYLAGVRALCDRHGILLIADEVMTGFGRIGDSFGCKRLGFVPDLITFAKGVTSAYVPLGGVLVRESLARYYDGEVLGAGHTYSGHPLAVAAGRAALREYAERNLFARAREIETWLREGLEAIAAGSSVVGDVRGIGAFFALEFVKDKQTREPLVAWQGDGMGPLAAFYKNLLGRGVYAFGRFNVTVIAPPLTIEREELALAFEALAESIAELERGL
jgi:taurine--2-oxoglutarate transaminase